MQVSGIKTKADALAAVESYEPPKLLALPELKEDANEKAKAAHAASVADINRRNEINQRQIDFVNAAKAFVKSRIEAVPDSVQVVGIEVRANVGEIEMFSMRIIQHK